MAVRDAGPSGILLLDKPAGVTSTRALAMAKRALGSRKGGHTGTLDPFATGLLPLAFGEATKFSRFLLDASKGYLATLHLGRTSSTGDPEGVIVNGRAFDGDRAMIDDVVASFLGEQWQVPPMHSALHHEGRRLYELAREGVEVPREPRRITIASLDVVSIAQDRLTISVICSKGTYIRVLAEDIGRRLGCGAYLTSLRRVQVGPFRVAQAVTLEELQAAGSSEARRQLLPSESFVVELPRIGLDPRSALLFTQGQIVEGPGDAGEVAVFETNRFLGVGLRDGQGRLSAVRLMATGTTDSPDFA